MRESLIDYFKFEVLVDFEKSNSPVISTVFDLLVLDAEEYVTRSPIDNMQKARTYDEHIILGYNPNSSADTKLGCESFYIVDMTGQACREFELRGGNWFKLLKFIFNNKALFQLLRVDLAKDDTSGIIPFDEMKDLLKSQRFVSAFRSSPKQVLDKRICSFIETGVKENRFEYQSLLSEDIVPEEWEDSLRFITKTGFTCDFGNKKSLQLEIYDKKVERIVNNCPSIYGQWIRFEMRFGSIKADNLLPYLANCENEKDIDELCSNLLSALIDFRDIPADCLNRHHYSEYASCTWWKSFLDSSEPVRIKPHKKYSSTLDRTINWIKESVATSWGKLLLVDNGVTLNRVLSEAMGQKLIKGKFNNRVISEINNYCREHGLATLNHCESIRYLYDIFSEFCTFDSGEIVQLEDIMKANVITPKKEREVNDYNPFEISDCNSVNYEFKEIELPKVEYLDLFNFDCDVRTFVVPLNSGIEAGDFISFVEIEEGIRTGRTYEGHVTDTELSNDDLIVIYELKGLDY